MSEEERDRSADYYLGVYDATRHAANIILHAYREAFPKEWGADGGYPEWLEKVSMALQELERNACDRRELDFANHMGVRLDATSIGWDIKQKAKRKEAREE